MKKKIAIIGQFPPPIHGLSKAIDTLCNSRIKDEFELDKIDIKDNKNFLLSLMKILISKDDLYYLTISQSKFGNIRDLIIMKLVQIKKRKLLIHLHGGGFREMLDNEWGTLQRKINLNILENIDGVIVLGKSLKKIFYGIVPDEKILVVENCVDNEFVLSDLEFKEKMKKLYNKKECKVLYLSNFIKEKGYLDVLKAANYFDKINDSVFEFIFAGKFFDEQEKINFNKNISNLKNSKYVGTVYGEEKRRILEDSDVFILPTRYKNEGQPISIIEASINGLYVITTDHAGILDIVNEQNADVLTGSEIDKDIYRKLKTLNLKSKKEILECNRERILTDFSEKKYIESIYNIFKEIGEKV